MLCQFRNIFGAPGEGVHKQRLLGMAAFDLIGTLVMAAIISVFYDINITKSFLGLFLLAQIMHYVFCVNTAFLVAIGLGHVV